MTTNKLIAGITAGAIAFTSIGSAPAYADKDFNALLGALVVGVLINEKIKSDKKKKRAQTAQTYSHTHNGLHHIHESTHPFHSRNHQGHTYQVPNGTEITYDKKKKRKHKASNLPLPSSCKHRHFNNKPRKNSYSYRCLERNGYKISKNGVVTHRGWDGRTARPVLY